MMIHLSCRMRTVRHMKKSMTPLLHFTQETMLTNPNPRLISNRMIPKVNGICLSDCSQSSSATSPKNSHLESNTATDIVHVTIRLERDAYLKVEKENIRTPMPWDLGLLFVALAIKYERP